ncbi:hypothetical protein AVEN_157795-1 [Araneus ventricosus]|uniref:DDE-1 domain-containing protein n=1 Tax=Araneus ventricosus TaxID=182803 RepID=A0A4Y2ILV3_ARAVE|nr:hypothetical protein AVEN_157795-1 [Araneus ventricosus]
MFILPRKKENPLLMDDAPLGSFAVYHESDWINKDTYLVWFKKFIEHSNPGPKKPVSLIIGSRNSHTKSLELVNLVRANNVMFLCFPLHTTHRLQSLDVSFMAPLKTTEKPLDNTSKLKQASFNEDVEHQPSTSSSKTMPTVEPQPCSTTFNISPVVVMPFPRETERLITRVNDKRRGKTAILTSSPYKAELDTIERERSGKKNKRKRALFKKITILLLLKIKKQRNRKWKNLRHDLMRSRRVMTLASFVIICIQIQKTGRGDSMQQMSRLGTRSLCKCRRRGIKFHM